MRFTAMAGLLLDTAALAMPLIKPGCRGSRWPSPAGGAYRRQGGWTGCFLCVHWMT